MTLHWKRINPGEEPARGFVVVHTEFDSPSYSFNSSQPALAEPQLTGRSKLLSDGPLIVQEDFFVGPMPFFLSPAIKEAMIAAGLIIQDAVEIVAGARIPFAWICRSGGFSGTAMIESVQVWPINRIKKSHTLDRYDFEYIVEFRLGRAMEDARISN